MLRQLIVLVALTVATAALAASASAAGGPGGDMTQAQANGWDCTPQILIGGYYHCAPPGKPSVANLIEGSDASTLVLRVFRPGGSFAGTELLLRSDLYAGQSCPQDMLPEWDLLPFGYYACHHFNT